jgi:hypothetical protein
MVPLEHKDQTRGVLFFRCSAFLIGENCNISFCTSVTEILKLECPCGEGTGLSCLYDLVHFGGPVVVTTGAEYLCSWQFCESFFSDPALFPALYSIPDSAPGYFYDLIFPFSL